MRTAAPRFPEPRVGPSLELGAATARAFAELHRAIAAAPLEERPAVVGALHATLDWLQTMRAPITTGDNNMPDVNLGIEEAARRLSVSISWLYHNADALPFTVRAGRRVLFSARGVQNWNGNGNGRGRRP